LLRGNGADAVFSSTAMLVEWIEHVEAARADESNVMQLELFERAA
jgi:hypothetical protein